MEVPAPDIKTSDTPIESSEADWRRYLFLREEMRHEDNLINQRVSWLIGSQAFARLFFGVGAGVRYYTAIGPIRLDIGVPLNKLQGGDSFEIYIGLGQSF